MQNFKKKTLNMVKELKDEIEKFLWELETKQKEHIEILELKNKITKTKNSIGGFNRSLNTAWKEN